MRWRGLYWGVSLRVVSLRRGEWYVDDGDCAGACPYVSSAYVRYVCVCYAMGPTPAVFVNTDQVAQQGFGCFTRSRGVRAAFLVRARVKFTVTFPGCRLALTHSVHLTVILPMTLPSGVGVIDSGPHSTFDV